MLKIFASFVFLFPLTSSQHYHCCMLHQWEGSYFAVTGYVEGDNSPDAVLEGSRVHYDYHGFRTAASGRLYYENSGRHHNYTLIHNYQTKKRLYVEDNVCQIISLEYPMRQPCIPNNYTHVGPMYIGTAPGNLSLDIWMAPDQHPNEFHMHTVTHECTLFQIRRVYFVPEGEEGATSASFSSIHQVTSGIKDDSVFDTPSECQPLTDESIIPQAARDMLSLLELHGNE